LKLIVTFCEISEHKPKSIPIIKELGAYKLHLCNAFLCINPEKLNECLLVAWAALREHSLVVKLSSDVSLN